MADIGKMTVLIVSSDVGRESSKGRMLEAIKRELESADVSVKAYVSSDSVKIGLRVLGNGADAMMVDWNLQDAPEIVRSMRSVDPDIGIFLMIDPESIDTVPHGILPDVSEYLWILGDTPSFIAGRVEASMRRYRKAILPPMFKRLVEFSEDYEHSWHTPGHTAGTAFLKSPVGRLFHNFFGDRLFRSDLSVSVRELGSLLGHSGPIGEAERYAAKVFGADTTFFVTNGTSASNRIVGTAMAAPGDVVIIDRNCHKSVEHAITSGRTVPVYLLPVRNRYGIMGPIPAGSMSAEAIRSAVAGNRLIGDGDAGPALATLTNSTYDGISYDAVRVTGILGETVDCIHFDEAWHGYARFNGFYAGRYAMFPDGRPPEERPTVISTQSTHKVLAALSQASMIHIKNGRRAVVPALFNESYMMHVSTSPSYAILASLDVSSKMMDSGGRSLTRDSLEEAVRFRQTMARLGDSIASGDPADWWFGMWQPETVRLPSETEERLFTEVPARTLAGEPDCWLLRPGDAWHGFGDLEEGWAMLDPAKVTVLTPGIGEDGGHSGFGIPAAIVVAFLRQRGIVCEKSGDYNMLFLFTMGVTNGKWGTLVSVLSDFKRLFDADETLDDMLPDLVSAHPGRYSGMRISQLAEEMHGHMASARQTQIANEACSAIPEQAMTPADAYACLVRGEVEPVAIGDACDRIAATGIVPYPPGIPLLMPGERTGCDQGSVLGYLRALESFDGRFPGFEHESHGVSVIDGVHTIYCIKE